MLAGQSCSCCKGVASYGVDCSCHMGRCRSRMPCWHQPSLPQNVSFNIAGHQARTYKQKQDIVDHHLMRHRSWTDDWTPNHTLHGLMTGRLCLPASRSNAGQHSVPDRPKIHTPIIFLICKNTEVPANVHAQCTHEDASREVDLFALTDLEGCRFGLTAA